MRKEFGLNIVDEALLEEIRRHPQIPATVRCEEIELSLETLS